MQEYINFGLLAFTSFFSLINPLGIMPVFMTMTSSLSPSERKITAIKAVSVAFFTMVVFAFGGKLLFSFFGISVNSFRVVGGVIFFLMGMDMLQARLVRVKLEEDEVRKYVNDISVTPLAIPMICGPGAITNSIVLMEDAFSVGSQALLIVMMAFIMLLTFLILLSSTKLIKWMGETGNNVMMRLMGLIIMVIAVEFFISGLTPIIRQMLAIG
jgi:multiple antibiotic resistance protein